jgi:hypothetical protein
MRGLVCLLYMLLALASAVFLGSESLGPRDHILLSQTRDFPFRRLLRLAGSRWRYSTPPPHSELISHDSCYIVTEGTWTYSKHISHDHYAASLLASSIVACWAVFTELLPDNALIKSVTILKENIW